MSISYILVGMLIGFLSGVFGIGGSIIATPILKIVFGLPTLIALASPLPVTIPTALGAIYGYWQKKRINIKIALITILGGLPATILGALFTKVVSGTWLMILTGLFVIFVSVRLLYGSSFKHTDSKNKIAVPVKTVLIGVIAGTFSGLLAVGGGIILVPAFILILGLSMQEAVSTSLLCVAAFAIPGTLVHWGLNHIDWHLVLNLSMGVIPAGYLGSKLGLAVKSKQLQTAFGIFLMLFGLYFILKEINIL